MPKNLTTWIPPSGHGYVIEGANNNLVTNSGSFLVDNLGNFLVTNTTTVKGKSTGAWTLTPKTAGSWVNQTIVTGTANSIADPSGVLLVDPSGVQIVDTGETQSGKNETVWSASIL